MLYRIPNYVFYNIVYNKSLIAYHTLVINI